MKMLMLLACQDIVGVFGRSSGQYLVVNTDMMIRSTDGSRCSSSQLSRDNQSNDGYY